MKINIQDFAEAAKEGELDLKWFTDKQDSLDEMAELGFSAYYIAQLKAELDLVRQVIFPEKQEQNDDWLRLGAGKPS